MRVVSPRAQRERTPFFGREHEKALLLDELGQGTGLLTLTGPSGMGKTRLARLVAIEVADSVDSEGGAWICSLEGAQDPFDVEAAVARMLGVPGESGPSLIRAIGNRGRMLLVLDNLDSVASSSGEVIGSWLDFCVELQMIATSIVPIGIEGEARFNLGPLELEDATALYLQRARHALAGRRSLEGEREAVEELVGRLDRIPLAIELAAARVQVFPPRELLSRFGERFTLLQTRKKGRHGSLLEAMSTTWELLDPEEQLGLARMSCFEGGFDLEAATAILSSDPRSVETADLLGGLRSKALIQVDEPRAQRFSLLESVRDFAATKLRDLGQESRTQERHSTYYVGRAEKELERIEGRDEGSATEWLRAERENLLAILRRGPGRQAALAGMAISAEVLHTETIFGSTLHLFDESLAAARQGGDPLLLARALGFHAAALPLPERADEAEKELQEALALVRAAGDPLGEGRLLHRMGMVQRSVGEFELAERAFHQAAELGRKTNTPLLEGAALLGLQGLAANARQDNEEAERLCTRAIEILQHHGSLRREAGARVWLATNWAQQGLLGKARQALQEVLAMCEQADLRQVQSYALNNLASLELTVGRLEDAERHGLRALALHRGFDNRGFRGVLVGNLGLIALERGELSVAESRLREGIWLLEDVGARLHHAVLLAFLAVWKARHGRVSGARSTLEDVRTTFVESGYQPGLHLLAVIEGSIEVAVARSLAATDPEQAGAWVAKARSRLEDSRTHREQQVVNINEAARMLEQDLAGWEDGTIALSPMPDRQPPLRVGEEARWFELEGKGRVDLRRRVALRRLLNALIEHRLDSPGEGLDTYQLFERGWPGVDIHPEASARRVYLGIWMLRNLGLSNAIILADGYFLDPAIPLLRDD